MTLSALSKSAGGSRPRDLLLSQGRAWRIVLGRGAGVVTLAFLRDGLEDGRAELRDARFDVPIARWNGLVKHLLSDRKLLGGMLLDFASQKDQVAAVISDDRLLAELQRVALEATATLVEAEVLVLTPVRDDSR